MLLSLTLHYLALPPAAAAPTAKDPWYKTVGVASWVGIGVGIAVVGELRAVELTDVCHLVQAVLGELKGRQGNLGVSWLLTKWQ